MGGEGKGKDERYQKGKKKKGRRGRKKNQVGTKKANMREVKSLPGPGQCWKRESRTNKCSTE